jgi:YVTN family beta-propeller protein
MHTGLLTFLGFIYISFVMMQTAHASLPTNIYQYTQAGMLSPAAKKALFRVYVPNGGSGSVSIIDPTTYKVIQTFYTGKDPQHVVPSYDLQTLWVVNNRSNSVTPIDPLTGKPGANIAVQDPYNLYFTPDGKYAIVVCEARKQLQFHDPKTMQLRFVLPIQCGGVNHMDFTADDRYAIVTCEYSGQLMKIDLMNYKVVNYLSLSAAKSTQTPPTKNVTISALNITKDGQVLIDGSTQKNKLDPMKSMPQDIRSSADGRLFFVADMMRDGLVVIDPINLTKVGFIPTGIGTHGIYPSRDGKLFYVSNRGCHHLSCGPHGPGSISVVDPVKKAVIATWAIPQGGSPDMGNITADGKELWLSGRYDNEVYVFDTTKGLLTHRIPVGKGPHGLAVWPQPGRYSLGHTGNMR